MIRLGSRVIYKKDDVTPTFVVGRFDDSVLELSSGMSSTAKERVLTMEGIIFGTFRVVNKLERFEPAYILSRGGVMQFAAEGDLALHDDWELTVDVLDK